MTEKLRSFFFIYFSIIIGSRKKKFLTEFLPKPRSRPTSQYIMTASPSVQNFHILVVSPPKGPRLDQTDFFLTTSYVDQEVLEPIFKIFKARRKTALISDVIF